MELFIKYPLVASTKCSVIVLLLITFLIGTSRPYTTCAVTVEDKHVQTKLYAIHFPQFHRDRVNDKLWGIGFTEWNNVKSAPLRNRNGHTLALPSELGYYNLLNYDVRKKQRDLALQYGIDGFIYHHYWFHHRGEGAVLSRALERMLEDGEPNLPFALNWVKESFVTTWNSKFNASTNFKSNSEEILWRQVIPAAADDWRITEHYSYLRRYFHHRNYIRISGAPLFTVYGSHNESTITPAVLRLLERLKHLAIADGFPPPGLHIPLLRMMTSHPLYRKDMAVTQMQPHLSKYFDSIVYYPYADAFPKQLRIPLWCRMIHDTKSNGDGRGDVGLSNDKLQLGKAGKIGKASSKKVKGKRIDETGASVGILTTFDNTPRRNIQDARIFDRTFARGVTPQQSLEMDVVTAFMYERCCSEYATAVHKASSSSLIAPATAASEAAPGSSFILINAWNEWGEGMMLEPSTKYNRTLLEAVRDGKQLAGKFTAAKAPSAAGGGGGGCDWQAYTAYLHAYGN